MQVSCHEIQLKITRPVIVDTHRIRNWSLHFAVDTVLSEIFHLSHSTPHTGANDVHTHLKVLPPLMTRTRMYVSRLSHQNT